MARGAYSAAISEKEATLPLPDKSPVPAPSRRRRRPAKHGETAPAALPEKPQRGAAIGKPEAQPDGNALLAYMKRAARLRRDE